MFRQQREEAKLKTKSSNAFSPRLAEKGRSELFVGHSQGHEIFGGG
jgi:hypothetical protein